MLTGPFTVTLAREATAIVIHNQGEPSTVANPSRRSFMAPVDRRGLPVEAGTLKRGKRQKAETMNERPSTANAIEVPANATIDAPIAGPATSASCLLKFPNELALLRASAGTISGTMTV